VRGEGISEAPSGVRYVITLDADTRLPRGTAAALVGTMAHRLHRPVLDPKERRVVDGYAVLQPRVTPTMPMEGKGTLFQKIFSGPSGIDPYASASSDVYQDLFHEGSYTGKGIYEVDTFEAALAGRVPENALLSHDLFEGIFTRAGLASDVALFDEFPSRYATAAARQHRWARGDWQLLPWILGRGVPFIGRWKMLDNLRRTLSPPAAFLTLLAGWLLPGTQPLVWTGFVLATLLVPALLPFLVSLVPRRRGISKRTYLHGLGLDLAVGASQSALTIALLAHQAALMADAIVRTIVRMDITRRKLLDWLTSAQARTGVDPSLGASYRRMWAPALAAATAATVALKRPEALPWLWPSRRCGAPRRRGLVGEPSFTGANTGTHPGPRPPARSGAAHVAILRSVVGRKTTSCRPTICREPQPCPTLLSTVAARDFGWIGTTEMVDRLEATLSTVERLERSHGHLFNWYDTRDLRPLDPRYISSVDSGNLAGHLLVVLSACREALGAPLLGPEILEGVRDALTQAREAAAGLAGERRTQTATLRHLEQAIALTEAALDPVPASLQDWKAHLRTLVERAETLFDTARAIAAERGEAEGARSWSGRARCWRAASAITGS
jgi:cyclic beta-1,2-glucan synthetase